MTRVLICEPAAVLRDELARSIRSAGWSVALAPNAEAARALAHEPGIAAALVDVAQPAGLALVETLRRRSSPIAVLATAAGGDGTLALAARGAGADVFLRKPFGIDALETWLGRVFARTPTSGAVSPEIVTRDPGMLRCLALADFAATSSATVVIVGESGTGKELLARRLHARSAAAAGPFVVVSGGGLDADGEELFGGDRTDGAFRSAAAGTLLLDEPADLPPRLQRLLLERLEPGEAAANDVHAPRLIVAARRRLAEDVAHARLLPELALRLGVIVLELPPLRDRAGDVALLARHFAQRLAEQAGTLAPRIGEATLGALARLAWRGNVRELENWVRRAVMLYPDRDPDLDADGRMRADAAEPVRSPELVVSGSDSPTLNLRELERRTILRSLELARGNRTRASRALGISIRTLRNKIREFGLAER